MKKIGVLIFIIALAVGVVLSNFFSFGKYVGNYPVSFSFGSKVRGSGNVVTEKRDIRNFSSVKVHGGAIEVEIVAQKDFGLEVEADDNLLSLIETEVDGQTLEIGTKKSYKTRNKIKIRVSAPNIDAIENSGASGIYLTNLDSESLRIESSGASRVKVEGKTKDLKVEQSGACRLDASGLLTNDAKIEASGASKSSINVSEKLSVELSGASKVNYKGNPSDIYKNTSGVSKISQQD
ncbi:MAG: head GIN domain-containing protein [Pyrinomonadaceae bacterium]